jgi:hypothetical protein
VLVGVAIVGVLNGLAPVDRTFGTFGIFFGVSLIFQKKNLFYLKIYFFLLRMI